MRTCTLFEKSTHYGSRAQTIINILLAWDGFLAWYYPLKDSIPFMCPVPMREERALKVTCS